MNIFEETIAKCEQYLAEVDEQNDKIIIILDDDKDWLETIKTKCKHNKNIIPISNTEEFRSFIHINGCAKMYIDINMDDQNGIDLAEDMGLDDYFGELFFVSNIQPPSEDLARIERLRAKFVLKTEVLEKIIYRDLS